MTDLEYLQKKYDRLLELAKNLRNVEIKVAQYKGRCEQDIETQKRCRQSLDAFIRDHKDDNPSQSTIFTR